jgi:AcrR family transcriptional regulator
MVTKTVGKNKQKAILTGTLALISERGFHDTPMSLIAQRSGVSTGIIYHYFENKDDLIHTLYQRIKQEFSAALLVGDPHELPWPDHLKLIWMNAYHYYITHPAETMFLEQYENSPYHLKWEEMPDENFTRLYALIEQDLAAGFMRPLPDPALYALTLGVASSLAKQQIEGTLKLSADQLAEIANAVCRAIAA